MKDRLRLAAWAGPVTIGSFAVVAVTGVLMFFHLNVGLVKLAHEWLSWLLVVGAVAHIALNWKPFLGYFRRPLALGVIVVFLALGALSLVPLGGGGARPPFMEISRAMENCPLTLAAELAGKPREALIGDLTAHGVHVHSGEQTLAEIATDNGVRAAEVMSHVFRGEALPAQGGRHH